MNTHKSEVARELAKMRWDKTTTQERKAWADKLNAAKELKRQRKKRKETP